MKRACKMFDANTNKQQASTSGISEQTMQQLKINFA